MEVLTVGQQIADSIEELFSRERFLQKVYGSSDHVRAGEKAAPLQFREAESTDVEEAHERLEWFYLTGHGRSVAVVKNNVGDEQIDILRRVLARPEGAGFTATLDHAGAGPFQNGVQHEERGGIVIEQQNCPGVLEWQFAAGRRKFRLHPAALCTRCARAQSTHMP